MPRRVLLVPSLFLFAACAGAPDTAMQDDAAAKASEPVAITQQQVEEGMQGFVRALRAGDAAQTGNYYATDATFISARGKVESVSAIGAFWSEAVTAGAGKSLDMQSLKWGTSGDLAWSLMHYTGGITAPTGHVLSVMQRQPDGALKTVAQISIPETVK